MEQEDRKSQSTDHTSQSSHSPQLYFADQSSPLKCLTKPLSPSHSYWISDFSYSPGTILGRGSFGQVFKATHKRTEQVYALKIIDKALIDSPSSMTHIIKEIDILSRINHPHIIRLLNHYEDSSSIYLLMPYESKGQLYTEIQKTKHLDDCTTAQYALEVIDAVKYLHSLKPKIVHRDLKPENLLLDDNKRIILTDFGTGIYLEEGEKIRTYCGSPDYLAPEIVKGIDYDERVDIWAIGVLLYEMLTGTTPFKGETLSETKSNICRLKISWPNDLQPLARNLISKILQSDPKERQTLDQIKLHPFFSRLTKRDEEDELGPLTKRNPNKSYIRKESMSLFHKPATDDSLHLLLNQFKAGFESSKREIAQLKNQIACLQSTNTDLMALNVTISNENNSLYIENKSLLEERQGLLQRVDELTNAIEENELKALSIQSECFTREQELHQASLSLAFDYKKLSTEHNQLKYDYDKLSSMKTSLFIDGFQLELFGSDSSTVEKCEVKKQLKEIETMLKEIKRSFLQIICSNCQEVKSISSFYKENNEFIRKCYLNTFTSLNCLIYQMDNDVKKSIEKTITSLSEHHEAQIAERLKLITEQNTSLQKYREEHSKQQLLIERLESANSMLKNKNDLLQKEQDVYVLLTEHFQEKVAQLSSELFELK